MLIRLGKSTNYLRLISFIHLFAAWVVIQSAFLMPIQLALLIILLLSIHYIFKLKTPMPNVVELSYCAPNWYLEEIDGQIQHYEAARIGFNSGLFFIVKLSDEHIDKNIIIFKDQLTLAQYRTLNVISKISLNKKQKKDTHVSEPSCVKMPK